MAKRVSVTFVDDIDGASAAVETVGFAVDGVNYEIDLAEENAGKLRSVLAPWIASARRVSGRKSRLAASRNARADRGQSATIREWARRQGLDISTRGRIPRSVLDAYQKSA
ncbi:MAG: Lsr2 family protein [Mycobacteriaceae bacterium]|nr:Lsr2 family protein [Mycobacteriaceae bacterium]